jgi:hypothetical protein
VDFIANTNFIAKKVFFIRISKSAEYKNFEKNLVE